MKKKKTFPHSRTRNKTHLIYTLLALVLGLSCHSCTDLPAQRVQSAEISLERFAKDLSTALRQRAAASATTTTTTDQENSSETVARRGNTAPDFSACSQFFANRNPPLVSHRPTDRALCYDAFAIQHSGESKTAVFVAERLNKASIADANEKRTNRFFPEARLRSA